MPFLWQKPGVPHFRNCRFASSAIVGVPRFYAASSANRKPKVEPRNSCQLVFIRGYSENPVKIQSKSSQNPVTRKLLPCENPFTLTKIQSKPVQKRGGWGSESGNLSCRNRVVRENPDKNPDKTPRVTTFHVGVSGANSKFSIFNFQFSVSTRS